MKMKGAKTKNLHKYTYTIIVIMSKIERKNATTTTKRRIENVQSLN